MRKLILALCVVVGFLSYRLLADTIRLNDGTIIQGRVIEQGDKYWVKNEEGDTQVIDKSLVKSITKEGAASIGASGSGTSSIGSTSIGSTPSTPGSTGSSSFAAVKSKASLVDSPIAGVGLWQTFIDSKPSAADLAAAKLELANWQKLVDGNAEKIKGKWIGGAEREKLMKDVAKLLDDGSTAIDNNQMLVGIEKFEAAVKLYPNTF
jgi:hypothetical protein